MEAETQLSGGDSDSEVATIEFVNLPEPKPTTVKERADSKVKKDKKEAKVSLAMAGAGIKSGALYRWADLHMVKKGMVDKDFLLSKQDYRDLGEMTVEALKELDIKLTATIVLGIALSMRYLPILWDFGKQKWDEFQKAQGGQPPEPSKAGERPDLDGLEKRADE